MTQPLKPSLVLFATTVTTLCSCKFDRPADVPWPEVDAMPCAASSCEDSVLRVCGSSGTVDHVEQCRLGCFSNDRCNWIAPSNGLASQLAAAANQAVITLPAGTIINTDTGTVRSGEQVIAVATETVTQSGAASLRVFLANAWTIHEIRVQGSLPVAFVAVGDVLVDGVIDVSADRGALAPGSHDCGTQGVSEHAA